MKNYSNQKGVTLVALAVTMIVLVIIAGVGISTGISGHKKSNDAKLVTELEMVQHAVLEQYVKYKATKDEDCLIGSEVPKETIYKMANELGVMLDKPSDTYYKLNKSDLAKIGIVEQGEDEYIVNYASGETINATRKKLSNGDPLYVSANK